MFNRKAAGKIVASAVAAASLAASVAAPLMAANAYDTSKQEFANNLSAPTMEKYLIMKKGSNVPNVTFNFAISGNVTEKAASATELAVYAGTRATGTPTIGSATFATGDTTYDSAYQNLANDLGGNATGRTDASVLGPYIGTSAAPATTDAALAASGKQYAKKDVTIDFSNVKFPEPGVYRYKITETTADTSSIDVKDEDGKYLDVYVEHKTGTTDTLVVTGYVLHDEESTVKIDGTHTPTTTNTKDGGFVNEYLSQNLTFGKQVDGNQGSKDKYFEFTLTLTGGTQGDVYAVDITDADGSIAANPNSATTKISSAVTNPTSITVGADGTVTQKFYLQADQSIVVKNIAKGVTYTVTEDNEDYVKTPASSSAPVAYNRAANTLNAGSISATDAPTGTIGTADINTGFKNTRNGTIPTGLMFTVFPGAAAVLLGSAGAVFVMKKKREDN